MFYLFQQPIDPLKLKETLRASDSGACAVFEGWVRDHNEGRQVSALEYEAHENLCQKEARAIFTEAGEKFTVTNINCVHRVGRLNIGEIAVWIGVSAPHRDAAFKACRYIIDEIKDRLPIWKKEFYVDGDSGWVNSASCCHASKIQEFDYYAHQTILPEVGLAGQEQLKKTKVLVVGAGGLGSAALTSLAQAGVGTLGICEFEKLEPSNLHRQAIYSHEDIGKLKIDLAARYVRSLNPFVRIERHSQKLKAANVQEILNDYEIVLDCTNNFLTKFLLNDACYLFKKILVQASLFKFEGQLRVYSPKQPSACLRCLWSTLPDPGSAGNYTDSGVLGAAPNVLGHLQAFEVIKTILDLPGRLAGETLIFNLKSLAINKAKETSFASCPLCGLNPDIKTIDEKNYQPAAVAAWSIELSSIPSAALPRYQFMDIREDKEREADPILLKNCIDLPLSRFANAHFPFDSAQPYLIFCENGLRSLHLVQELHHQGITNVHAVSGGIKSIKQLLLTNDQCLSNSKAT